ncbi:MAG: peroxiredoxin [Candidatus Micrarchaeota archaeon]|nr:peroxiredoxin [Candidatus Micrarchaeota archaeon]
MTQLAPGQKAPAFSLKDENGKARTPTDVSKLVLYFYPKDFTPGCTIQIADFSKLYAQFKAKGYEIYGVSPDSPESHKKFCDAFKSPYPLLSDPDAAVAKAYGAWGERGVFGQGLLRSTFVIENGVLAQVHYRVKALAHADKLLESL